MGVLFWNKLHTSGYKIGALPYNMYYFQNGKFVIHDSNAKKLILPLEDKVSIKIIKDCDSYYSLAISNNNGKAISSIGKIDNPNYELLSDSSHFNLEEDNIALSDQHHEYNLYPENGLVKMFDCTDDYACHDHTLFDMG